MYTCIYSSLYVSAFCLVLVGSAALVAFHDAHAEDTFNDDDAGYYDDDNNDDDDEDDCGPGKCICTTKYVNCYVDNECKVERIPVLKKPYMYRTITNLNMSYCTKLVLTESSFVPYTNLRVLTLYDCSLNMSSLPLSTFSTLKQLEYLDISRNEMFPLTNHTPAELFSNLSSLRELRAYGNTGTYHKGSGYAERVFVVLRALRVLWIDGFEQKFGSTFQNLTSLEELRLSGDQIDPPWRSLEFCEMETITNEALTNLIHIKRLYILQCGVEHIEVHAFEKLAELEYLDLTGNINANFSEVIKALRSLSLTVKELVLNQIQDTNHMSCGVVLTKPMAKQISQLNITTLHLRQNAINSIDKYSFKTLPRSLTHVYLSENEFEMGMYLFYIAKMPNLKFLDVSFNFFANEYMIWRQEPKLSSRHYLTSSVGSHDTDRDFLDGPLQSVRHHTPAKCPNTTFDFPPGTITVYLPPKLEILHINHSKLGFPIIEFFFDPNNVIRVVDASHSMLYCLEGPIHGIESIEEVDLGYNGCAYCSYRFFLGFPNLQVLQLESNLLGLVIQNDEDGNLFRNNSRLRNLDISFNHLQQIPQHFLKHQSQLERLVLSDNGIRTFELALKHMVRLKIIDLRNNHIATLNETMRQQLEEVTSSVQVTVLLQGNPIECSCTNVDFLRWVLKYMNTSERLNVMIDNCYNNSGTFNISSPSGLQDIVYGLDKACAKYTVVIVSAVIVFVFIMNVIVAVIVHKFRWKIRYWYYVARATKAAVTRDGYTLIDDNFRFKYHVYIASVSEDNEFVVEILKPKLTTRYKLFLQEDDIIPGQNVYSIISNALHVSQVVVFVISKECEDDEHWNTAVQFAKLESCRRGQQMFLCIFLDANREHTWPTMLELMKTGDYLDFPVDCIEQVEAVFWQECMEKIENMKDGQVLSIR